jgi:hypothetical protein
MKPDNDKTWLICKRHFLQFARDMKHDSTTGSGGYANFCTEIKQEVQSAISELKSNQEQFANMASDKENINVLNIRLKSELAATKAQLSVLQDLLQLQRPPPNYNQQPPGSRDYRNKPHYCHTHGYNDGHDSPICKKPATGHQVTATRDNPMGGKGHRKKAST